MSKGQADIMQTVLIVVVFLIVVMVILTSYIGISQSAYEKEQSKLLQAMSYTRMNKITNMLVCDNGCIDFEKASMLEPSEYFDEFAFSKITILYPQGGLTHDYVLYDNVPSQHKEKLTYFKPVVLLKDETRLGAIIKYEAYR